jgi:ABC-type transport system involved in cytochrome c biogenesis ATPase subunit/GNAT superfamily N-acetyltransferase
MALVTVETAVFRHHTKVLGVRGPAGGASFLQAPRFALVGPGDELRIRAAGPTQTIDLKGETEQSWIPVVPTFEAHEKFKFADGDYLLRFHEVEGGKDLTEYLRLESFHYRGRNLDADPQAGPLVQKGTGGRKAVLLVSLVKGRNTRTVGYIELQMPLMMCKPRHELFDNPFQHRREGVKWQTWLGDGQVHVNRIVRIARVVVDPEFRGLGISSQLVETAKRFAAERWTVGGKKPLFIEISAEMLRYVDFVSKAGLPRVGYTEGNLERIFKDLRSIERGAKGKSQIMSLQRKYYAAFSEYCQQTGRSFDEARAVLQELLQANDPRSAMPSDEWLAFRPILRFPIPYHIGALDEEANGYLSDSIASLRKRTSATVQDMPQPQMAETPAANLTASELEVWIDQELSLTPFVRLAMDSFGIDTPRLRTKLVGPVSLDLCAGNVVLITGSSGAGKSVLLDQLAALERSGLSFRGQIKRIGKVGYLKPLPERTPILQYFGERYGAERAFDALCRVGLSEAMAFIKPFSVLSMGQRYRAMLASLLLSQSDLWFIDEFCANLDPITASTIASQIRRLAKKRGAIVVAAAANTTHFVADFAPDTILVVRTGGDVISMTTREYRNGFFEKGL